MDYDLIQYGWVCPIEIVFSSDILLLNINNKTLGVCLEKEFPFP